MRVGTREGDGKNSVQRIPSRINDYSSARARRSFSKEGKRKGADNSLFAEGKMEFNQKRDLSQECCGKEP